MRGLTAAEPVGTGAKLQRALAGSSLAMLVAARTTLSRPPDGQFYQAPEIHFPTPRLTFLFLNEE